MRPLSWLRSFLRPRSIRPIVKSRPLFRPAIDTLESRLTPSANFPSIDGAGHNLAHPDWGQAGSELIRIAPAEYSDGVSTPAGADRPSAREISNAIADQGDDVATNARDMSAFVYAWGQFLDHDIDLTTGGASNDTFNIPVPTGDPDFDPNGTGTQSIPLTRSAFDPATGSSTSNPRQQINDITAWIDGSMIYGSDEATANSLRTGSGGKLKTSDGNLLPIDAASGQFLAGDIRSNENPGLVSLQTLFVREHNRIADQIAARDASLSDQQIYDRARMKVIAEIQAITYNEFLPALLGPAAPGAYRGYNPNVNPGIANEFSTAAFRIGHTLVGEDIEFLNNDGQTIRPGVSLRDAFFNPSLVSENGIDPILKYLASDHAEEVDSVIIDDLRNFLFGAPGQGGLDLAALNIQRGRDHGLADYNATRVAYGLPAVRSFADITPDPELQQALEEMYGTVDDIDLWVGGLAEKHLPGASVGPTFARVITDQFSRLRAGDRFWYQNVFSGQERRSLESTKLADVIRRNTTVTNLQDNVFMFKTSISGRVVPPPPLSNALPNARPDSRRPGPSQTAPRLNGITVNLLGVDGSIVASTQTRADGSYTFTGVDLGTYRVQIVLSNNQTLPSTPPVAVTKGGDVRAPQVTLPAPESAPAVEAPIASPLNNPLPRRRDGR